MDGSRCWDEGFIGGMGVMGGGKTDIKPTATSRTLSCRAQSEKPDHYVQVSG